MTPQKIASPPDLNESRRTQLSFLQTRIIGHGKRMWQLPLTYLGLLLVILYNISDKEFILSPTIIFLVVSISGIVLFWGMIGAREGYSRTSKHMIRIEKELGLIASTYAPPSHVIPYFILMGIEIIFSIAMAIYFL